MEEKAFWRLMRDGQTCEILTPANDLIFLGKIHLTERRELVEVTDTAGQTVPPVLYNTPVKVKLYLSGNNAQILEALVCGSTRYFWRLDQLHSLHERELRENFRQKVSVYGKLRRAKNGDPPVEDEEGLEPEREVPCRLADLSLGGANLRCRERYAVGDWLRITEVNFPGHPSFAFTGQVCWFRAESRGELSYGCRFVDLEAREQDRLLKILFQQQRRQLQQRRGERVKGEKN